MLWYTIKEVNIAIPGGLYFEDGQPLLGVYENHPHLFSKK